MEQVKRNVRFLAVVAAPVVTSVIAGTLHWNAKLVKVIRGAERKVFQSASYLVGGEHSLINARNCKTVASFVSNSSFLLPVLNFSFLLDMSMVNHYHPADKNSFMLQPAFMRDDREMLNTLHSAAVKSNQVWTKYFFNENLDAFLEKGKRLKSLGNKFYASTLISHIVPMSLNILASPYIGVPQAAVTSVALLGSYLCQQGLTYWNCSHPVVGAEKLRFELPPRPIG